MNPFTVDQQRIVGVVLVGLFGLFFATIAALAAWDQFATWRDQRCKVPGCGQCGGPR